MIDTEEDAAPPASTPQDGTSRSCTRQTPCKKANCPSCCKPITENHHVQDVSQDIFSTLMEEFKQAFLDDKTEDIKAILNQYDLFGTTCPDFFKFDRTGLMKLVKTAHASIKPKSQPTPTPAVKQTHTLAAPRTIYLGTTPNSKTSNPTSVAALGLGMFGVFPICLLTTAPPKGTTTESCFGTKMYSL